MFGRSKEKKENKPPPPKEEPAVRSSSRTKLQPAPSKNFQYSLGVADLKDTRFYRALAAEFLGNFYLNFFGCGSCAQFASNGVCKALAFGLVIFLNIRIFGHLSGGHFNPAVSIAMLTIGRISCAKAIFYIIAQCVGSTVGSLFLKLSIHSNYYNGLGHTDLTYNVNATSGFVIECFLGFVLALTIFAVCDDQRMDTNTILGPLTIGFAVAFGHFGFLSWTGASMNPARTLGSAVTMDTWIYHWIYWLAPILGAILGALLYVVVYEKGSGRGGGSTYSF